MLLLIAFVALEARSSIRFCRCGWSLTATAADPSLAIAMVGVGHVRRLPVPHLLPAAHRSALSPLTTGLAFLPMIGLDHADGDDRERAGPPQDRPARLCVPTGMVLASLAMVLLTRIGVHTSYATHVLPALLVIGAGMGLVFAPAMATATGGVEPRDAGVASATVSTAQQKHRRLHRDRAPEHVLGICRERLSDLARPQPCEHRRGRRPRVHDRILVGRRVLPDRSGVHQRGAQVRGAGVAPVPSLRSPTDTRGGWRALRACANITAPDGSLPP